MYRGDIYGYLYRYIYQNVKRGFFLYGNLNEYEDLLDDFCSMYCKDIILNKLYDLYNHLCKNSEFNEENFIDFIKLYIYGGSLSYNFYLYVYYNENYMKIYNKILEKIYLVYNKTLLRILFIFLFNSKVYDFNLDKFNDLLYCFNRVYNKNFSYKDLVLCTIELISTDNLFDNVDFNIRDDLYSYLLYGMFSVVHKDLRKNLLEFFINVKYDYILRSFIYSKHLVVPYNFSLTDFIYVKFMRDLFNNLRNSYNVIKCLDGDIYMFLINLYKVITISKIYRDDSIIKEYNKLSMNSEKFKLNCITFIIEFYKEVFSDYYLFKGLKKILYNNSDYSMVLFNDLDSVYMRFYKKNSKNVYEKYIDIVSRLDLNVVLKAYNRFIEFSNFMKNYNPNVLMKDIISLCSNTYSCLLSVSLNCSYIDIINVYGNSRINVIDVNSLQCNKDLSSVKYMLYEIFIYIYFKSMMNILEHNSIEYIDNFNNNMIVLAKHIFNSSNNDIILRVLVLLCMSLENIGEKLLYDKSIFERFYVALVNVFENVNELSIECLNNIIKESIYTNLDTGLFNEILSGFIGLI